jgi:alpha-galactosidase
MATPSTMDFSTAKLKFKYKDDSGHLRLEHYCLQNYYLQDYSLQDQSWLHSEVAQKLFAVYIEGQCYDASNLNFIGIDVDYKVAGVQHVVAKFADSNLEVEQHTNVYSDTALIEMWQTIKNKSARQLSIERVDSFALTLPEDSYKLFYYTGNWGSEFEGKTISLDKEVVIDSRTGRSSKGHHPWFALTKKDGTVFSGSVAWSGNWVCRFEPRAEGGVALSGGLHDWCFTKELAPDTTMETPIMVMVLGKDLNEVSRDYARVGRKYWYPRTSLSALPPVEWNHWWSYEDDHINEKVFRDNVAVAKEMGMDVCVLDAGWFGPSDPGTFWNDYRGDWDLINSARFPNGMRPIADDVHAKGMKFGMWCEIEAVGTKARLTTTHPDLIARRDGEHLGQICLGNPETREWAYQTLQRLITENKLDWIKLDFNLDPGAGCNRTDHGHGAGDGLYEHYMGYYSLLERVRRDYPEVTLESCSSGGLRIDLGLLRRTDFTFLSDPDWPVHDLQLFWGASTMLAPNSILHWSFGDWINKNPPPQQNFNPRDPKLEPHQLDYYTRISMLNVFGISQKLPELPAWVKARLTYHTKIYKNHVRRFIREADLYRLSPQPKRDGSGERWCSFQYSLPDASEHLLFVFRLPGSREEKAVVLRNLHPNRIYQLAGFEGEVFSPQSGSDLMTKGLTFSGMPPESSWLLKLF